MKINFILKSSFILLMTIFFLNSCGKQVDAKKFPPDPKERVKRNLEEGKGFRLSTKLKGLRKGGGDFEFASSNPLWRASLDIIDFMPLSTANYNGGIIVTDWYSDDVNSNESLKVAIRFLTNEIRSDGIRIIVHKKRCNVEQSCKISKISSAIEQELQVAILKKAVIYEREYNKNKKKFKRSEVK